MQKLYIRVFAFLQLNTTNSTLDIYQQHISDLILKPDLNRSWAKIVNMGTELRFHIPLWLQCLAWYFIGQYSGTADLMNE